MSRAYLTWHRGGSCELDKGTEDRNSGTKRRTVEWAFGAAATHSIVDSERRKQLTCILAAMECNRVQVCGTSTSFFSFFLTLAAFIYLLLLSRF